MACLIQMLGLESHLKPLLQVGSTIGNLRRFDFRRHCSENGNWTDGFEVWMLSQLRRRVQRHRRRFPRGKL